MPQQTGPTGAKDWGTTPHRGKPTPCRRLQARADMPGQARAETSRKPCSSPLAVPPGQRPAGSSALPLPPPSAARPGSELPAAGRQALPPQRGPPGRPAAAGKAQGGAGQRAGQAEQRATTGRCTGCALQACSSIAWMVGRCFATGAVTYGTAGPQQVGLAPSFWPHALRTVVGQAGIHLGL